MARAFLFSSQGRPLGAARLVRFEAEDEHSDGVAVLILSLNESRRRRPGRKIERPWQT